MRPPFAFDPRRFFTPSPTLREKLVRRLTCPHTHYVRRTAYHEELHGHYDEYICTRYVVVFRCQACGKQRRVVREIAGHQVEGARSKGNI